MLSKKIPLQPVHLNAEILWYSFSPQYNKVINADRWRRRANQISWFSGWLSQTLDSIIHEKLLLNQSADL